jgi:hypothetical protein
MADETNLSSRELLDAALLVAEALQQAQVNYALIGGLATGIRTHSRFTRDADFLLAVPQLKLPALLENLEHRGFTVDHPTVIRQWTREHLTVLSFHGIRVDWLKPVIPLYQHVLDRATDEIWLNHPIRVASAEGLILTKLLSFRLQDQVDIENLVRANRNSLDLDWIRSEWQSVAPLDDPRMVRLMELVEGNRQ